jgi:hypothetical protein
VASTGDDEPVRNGDLGTSKPTDVEKA